MNARYVGKRDWRWGYYKDRAVELDYDYEKDREEEKFFRVCALMKIKGWEIETGVEGWGLCRVEDRNEAQDFIRDWKEAKRCISNCMKFGF